jgi:hypothetical protein
MDQTVQHPAYQLFPELGRHWRWRLAGLQDNQIGQDKTNLGCVLGERISQLAGLCLEKLLHNRGLGGQKCLPAQVFIVQVTGRITWDCIRLCCVCLITHLSPQTLLCSLAQVFLRREILVFRQTSLVGWQH